MQKVFHISVDIERRISTPAFEVNTNDAMESKSEFTAITRTLTK